MRRVVRRVTAAVLLTMLPFTRDTGAINNGRSYDIGVADSFGIDPRAAARRAGHSRRHGDPPGSDLGTRPGVISRAERAGAGTDPGVISRVV